MRPWKILKLLDVIGRQAQVHAGLVVLDLRAAGEDAADADVDRHVEVERAVGPRGELVDLPHPRRGRTRASTSRANAVYTYRSASTIIPALSGGRMLCTRRCAKSVACSSENVIGVSDIFFLPFFVTAFTRSALFHSVKNGSQPLRLRGSAWRAEAACSCPSRRCLRR